MRGGGLVRGGGGGGGGEDAKKRGTAAGRGGVRRAIWSAWSGCLRAVVGVVGVGAAMVGGVDDKRLERKSVSRLSLFSFFHRGRTQGAHARHTLSPLSPDRQPTPSPSPAGGGRPARRH